MKKPLANVIGNHVPLIDGGLGTSYELERKLIEKDLINDSKEKRKYRNL